MSSWKLKLVNIQRACKDYVCDDVSSILPAPGRSVCEGRSSRVRPFCEGHSSHASVDASGLPQVLSLDMLTNPVSDMVRLPANSKSRFSLEDHQCRSVQKNIATGSWLRPALIGTLFAQSRANLNPRLVRLPHRQILNTASRSRRTVSQPTFIGVWMTVPRTQSRTRTLSSYDG